MASASAPRKRRLPGIRGRSSRGDATRKYVVRAHHRSPRGKDAGKPRVRVRAYRRNAPRNALH